MTKLYFGCVSDIAMCKYKKTSGDDFYMCVYEDNCCNCTNREAQDEAIKEFLEKRKK